VSAWLDLKSAKDTDATQQTPADSVSFRIAVETQQGCYLTFGRHAFLWGNSLKATPKYRQVDQCKHDFSTLGGQRSINSGRPVGSRKKILSLYVVCFSYTLHCSDR
jgi:hypothetical protein